MFRGIRFYAVRYDAATNRGRFVFRLDNGRSYITRLHDPIEMQLVASLLRNEKPVFVNTTSGEIATAFEPTGEEET